MKAGNPILVALWQTDRKAAKEQIMPAMHNARGNVREAADKLGIHNRTLYRWIKEDPSLLDWGGIDSTCPFGPHPLGKGEGCGNCERWSVAMSSTIPPAPGEGT